MTEDTEDTGLQIHLEGKTYALDDFELGELEWVEDELGVSLDEVNPTSIKAVVRFITIIKRRDNPDFTLDDARKLTLRIFNDKPEENAPAARPTGRAKPKGSGAAAKS